MILCTMKREQPIKIEGIDFRIVDVLLKDWIISEHISCIDCLFDFLDKNIQKHLKTFKTFFCFRRHWSSITVLEVIKPGNWPNPVSQLDRNPPPPSQCVKMGFIWTFLGKQNEQRKQSLNSFLLFTIANCMPICSTQWFWSTLMPKTSYIDLRNVCIKFIFNSQCPPPVQLQSFYWCLCHFPRHFFYCFHVSLSPVSCLFLRHPQNQSNLSSSKSSQCKWSILGNIRVKFNSTHSAPFLINFNRYFCQCLCPFPQLFLTISTYLSHRSVVYFCAILKIKSVEIEYIGSRKDPLKLLSIHSVPLLFNC